MSYSTIYGLWPNTSKKKVRLVQFQNAWGMAPIVWDALARRHLNAVPFGWSQHADELWRLADSAAISSCAKAVLRMTFDLCYVRASDTPRAIDDIAIFLHSYKVFIPDGVVNHWPRYADALVTQWESHPMAFGVHQTSVSENPWDGPYDEATETRGPFDWSRAESVYV